MPKKISIQEKRDWLNDYESGKSIDDIAKDAKRHNRTIKDSLEDARRDRDARDVRAELLKDALYRHQDLLRSGLNNIIRSLEPPSDDYAPLSWYEGEKSIFKKTWNLKDLTGVHGISSKRGRPLASSVLVDDLLRQHFHGDKTWKMLIRWETAYLSHINDRLSFQEKLVSLVEQKTGCRMVEKEKDHPSFVYSYTTGPILYQAAIKAALSKANVYDATKNIKADPDLGRVVYSGSILAIAPGNEEDCRKKIIEAYNALLNSSEKQKMTASYADLLEVAAKARQAFEEINLLGYIPGSCNVCKRLGM